MCSENFACPSENFTTICKHPCYAYVRAEFSISLWTEHGMLNAAETAVYNFSHFYYCSIRCFLTWYLKPQIFANIEYNLNRLWFFLFLLDVVLIYAEQHNLRSFICDGEIRSSTNFFFSYAFLFSSFIYSFS